MEHPTINGSRKARNNFLRLVILFNLKNINNLLKKIIFFIKIFRDTLDHEIIIQEKCN